MPLSKVKQAEYMKERRKKADVIPKPIPVIPSVIPKMADVIPKSQGVIPKVIPVIPKVKKSDGRPRDIYNGQVIDNFIPVFRDYLRKDGVFCANRPAR